jgi:hypothetical protein
VDLLRPTQSAPVAISAPVASATIAAAVAATAIAAAITTSAVAPAVATATADASATPAADESTHFAATVAAGRATVPVDRRLGRPVRGADGDVPQGRRRSSQCE